MMKLHYYTPRFESKETLCCLRDYNERLSNELDTIKDLDNLVTERKSIDNVINDQ